MNKSEPKVVVIGGGTGSFVLLGALKKHTHNITALVNMADDGGSTGVLRDELGVLPPGDIRQCLVALSNAPEELRELFNFRFPKGTFGGHSFGNLFLSAVEKMTANFNQAVRIAGDVLQIQGAVLPVTLDRCELVCEVGRKKIKGQRKLELTDFPPGLRPRLQFKEPAHLNPTAKDAIIAADLVVIAPGLLYGSLIPTLLVDGMSQALQATSAKVVFVCNLVNKPNHTLNFRVSDYIEEIERFTGAGRLDIVLYNTDVPSPALLRRYAVDNELPVAADTDNLSGKTFQALGGSFLSHAQHERDTNDSFIKRSLIRHDGEAVAKTLLKLL